MSHLLMSLSADQRDQSRMTFRSQCPLESLDLPALTTPPRKDRLQRPLTTSLRSLFPWLSCLQA